MTPFVDALLAAPAGVALLARLEAAERTDVSWWESPEDSSPAAVRRAVATVEAMTVGELCASALAAAQYLAGPWMSQAPHDVGTAYLNAAARRPIAEVIDTRFGARLHAPLDRADQQWWGTPVRPGNLYEERTLFTDFEQVYGNGEFSWSALWTVSAPSAETHDELIGVWEMYPGPVSRWRLPVRDEARIVEIHRPEDWAGLAHAHPRAATAAHSGWELPGPDQRLGDGDVDAVRRRGLAVLLDVPGQRAAVTTPGRHLIPDWRSVAESFDGVHLSWAGFITSEGFVSRADDAVTMLRYWSSERTSWLSDVFGEPRPLGAPALSGAVDGTTGVSAIDDPARRAADRLHLRHLLGR